MLFTNDELKSIYDFEHDPDEIPDSMANLTDLAQNINDVIYQLCRIISDNDEKKKKPKEEREPLTKIEVNIPDNLGNPIAINPKKFYSSNIAEHSDIVKALQPSQTIQQHLLKLGIISPSKETPDFKRYLQLLYFFYMTKNIIFRGDNFLPDFEKRSTSELSPVDRASSGKYSYFILNNVLENDAVCRHYNHFNARLSKIEWEIVQCLDELLSMDNTPAENESMAISVQRIIDSVREMPIEPSVESNPLNKMAEWVYRLTAVAYAKDTLNNLDSKLYPFKFPEIEIRLNRIWMKKKLTVTPGTMSEDIREFLREKDSIRFCKQIDLVKNSPSDETKGNAYDFVQDFIEYDRTSIRNQIGHSLYVETDNKGAETIPAPIVALIVKTFIDIDNSEMDLYMPVKEVQKSRRRWMDSRKLISRLSATDQTFCGKAADLAMRLFLIALNSELMNMVHGYGYYYFFDKSALNSYRLEQKIRLAIYETDNPYDWEYRAQKILDALNNLKSS